MFHCQILVILKAFDRILSTVRQFPLSREVDVVLKIPCQIHISTTHIGMTNRIQEYYHFQKHKLSRLVGLTFDLIGMSNVFTNLNRITSLFCSNLL